MLNIERIGDIEVLTINRPQAGIEALNDGSCGGSAAGREPCGDGRGGGAGGTGWLPPSRLAVLDRAGAR